MSAGPSLLDPARIRPVGVLSKRLTGWATAAALLAGVAAAPVQAASPPTMPALSRPASDEHHVGKMIFAELITPDISAAKQFYAGLFGWTFQDVDMGPTRFSEALLDGLPVAGLVGRDMPAGSRMQPTWLTFIATRDVDAAQNAAVQKGARVLFGPRDIPDLGREAVLADPQGAVFAMLASSSGDPGDYLADPGAWIWSSLVTRDPDTDAAFYQTVFNYEVFDLPGSDEAQHLILASDNFARASVNPLPTDRPDARPYWLNFVRVNDAAAMAAKVGSLGGRVLLPPQLDRHGSRIAIVADPQGAPFGLMEWTENAPPGAAK